MISFENDYCTGAHPEVLQRLVETNMVSQPGYGNDMYCASAADKIRSAVGQPEAEVFFIAGGTQTNQTVISSLLKTYEGVIAATTGHISLHEAGAVEFTGHKVLELPAREGKLDALTLQNALEAYHTDGNQEQMVYPGMVYISFPTEYGTVYSKTELTAIHGLCVRYGIPLFVDGARLGYGLASPWADLTLPELAALCDVFYIGGTKMGTLCGEAVVFTGMKAPQYFRKMIKQRGAMLAKGRLMGAQFEALFTDDLYMRIGREGIRTAERLKSILQAKGYPFAMQPVTNQLFVSVRNTQLKQFPEEIRYSFWEKDGAEHTVIRFATSWATTDRDLDALEQVLPSAE